MKYNNSGVIEFEISMEKKRNQEIPMSSFSIEVESALATEDHTERGFLLASLGFDLIHGKCKAHEEDPSKRIVWFKQDSPYENYILPGAAGNPSSGELYRDCEPRHDDSSRAVVEVGGFATAEVIQCHLYGMPIDRNPLVYLEITECSALVAANETMIYVAHIGLSETGEIVGALNFFEKQGIPKEKVVAHASLGSSIYDTGVVRPDFDFRHAKMETYQSLGLTEEHIIPFKHKRTKVESGVRHVNARGLLVGRQFQVAFSFDLTQHGKRYESEKEIRDIVLLN